MGKTSNIKRKRGLSPKKALFIKLYLNNQLNGTKAYQQAYGVSEAVARRSASRLLTNVDVLIAINRELESRFARLDISTEAVLQEIARLAFVNIFDFIKVQKDGTAYVDLSSLTRDQAAGVAEISYDETIVGGGKDAKPIKKVKFKLADKLSALELLGKYLKLFSDTTPAVSSVIPSILQEVLDGALTARDAGYKINMLGLPLPEVLRIELTKQEPPNSDDGTYSATPTEELERRAAEMVKAAEAQPTSFVPERKREVEKLKEELKGHESFVVGEDE